MPCSESRRVHWDKASAAHKYNAPDGAERYTRPLPTAPIMPSDLDARRRSGRRVATLAPRPSQPDGALAPPSPQRSHSPPPPQTELQVCVCRSQRRAVRHTFTRTHSQARLTRRAEMRAILVHAQVLVAAAAAARSAERDAAPSTALMMVSVCVCRTLCRALEGQVSTLRPPTPSRRRARPTSGGGATRPPFVARSTFRSGSFCHRV